MVMHFKTTKERLDYLKGKHEEIIPVEAKPKKKSSRPTKAELAAQLTNPELYEAVEAKKARETENDKDKKPKSDNKNAKKSQKSTSKGKKND